MEKGRTIKERGCLEMEEELLQVINMLCLLGIGP